MLRMFNAKDGINYGDTENVPDYMEPYWARNRFTEFFEAFYKNVDLPKQLLEAYTKSLELLTKYKEFAEAGDYDSIKLKPLFDITADTTYLADKISKVATFVASELDSGDYSQSFDW